MSSLSSGGSSSARSRQGQKRSRSFAASGATPASYSGGKLRSRSKSPRMASAAKKHRLTPKRIIQRSNSCMSAVNKESNQPKLSRSKSESAVFGATPGTGHKSRPAATVAEGVAGKLRRIVSGKHHPLFPVVFPNISRTGPSLGKSAQSGAATFNCYYSLMIRS